MTKYHFQNLIYVLILLEIFINSYNGQVNTNLTIDKTNNSKPIPEIIGTPPLLGIQSGPVNDDSLVGRYITPSKNSPLQSQLYFPF